jgi:hypothetical protein
LNKSLTSFQTIHAVSRIHLGKEKYLDVGLRCNLINQVLRHADLELLTPH